MWKLRSIWFQELLKTVCLLAWQKRLTSVWAMAQLWNSQYEKACLLKTSCYRLLVNRISRLTLGTSYKISPVCVLHFKTNKYNLSNSKMWYSGRWKSPLPSSFSLLGSQLFLICQTSKIQLNALNGEIWTNTLRLASANILRSFCRCSGLTVLLIPKAPVTNRFASVADVAGRGLDVGNLR